MTRRVLVVDDDRQMVQTLRDILQLHGWEADGAHSGEDAIQMVERKSYLAVLMDVRMGGMNGVDTMKALHGLRNGLRVILMTAYTATELLADAERAGALRVLSKPVALPALIEMLEQTAEGARQVLVVDDDPDFLQTVSAILRARGFTTVEADGLNEALRRLVEGVPAAILLDLNLGSVAPRDTVVAIRQVSPAVALILCSGFPRALEDTVASVPGSWIHGSLNKPFSPDHLIALLDEIVVN